MSGSSRASGWMSRAPLVGSHALPGPQSLRALPSAACMNPGELLVLLVLGLLACELWRTPSPASRRRREDATRDHSGLRPLLLPGDWRPSPDTFPERFPEGSPRRGPGSSLPPGGPPSPRSPERSAWASSPGSGFPEAGPVPLTASGPFPSDGPDWPSACCGPGPVPLPCAGLARGPSGRLWRGRLSPGPRGSSTPRCRVPTRVSRRREFRTAPHRVGHSQVVALPWRLQHVLSSLSSLQLSSPRLRISGSQERRPLRACRNRPFAISTAR